MFTEIKNLLDEWFPSHDGNFIVNPQNAAFDALLKANMTFDPDQPQLLQDLLKVAKEKMDAEEAIKRQYIRDDISTFLEHPFAYRVLAEMYLRKPIDIIREFFGEQGKHLTQNELEYLKKIRIVIKGNENKGVYSYPHANSSERRKRPFAQLSLTELYFLIHNHLFFHKTTVPGKTSGTWQNGASLFQTSVHLFNHSTHSIEVILPHDAQHMVFSNNAAAQAFHNRLQSFTFDKVLPSFFYPHHYTNPHFYHAVSFAIHNAIPTYQQHMQMIYDEFSDKTSYIKNDWHQKAAFLNEKLGSVNQF